MKYDLKTPCHNCPFLVEGGIRLSGDARVREVAFSSGGEFPCHKTTVRGEDEDGEEDLVATRQSQVCAGAITFAYFSEDGYPGQMMRIAERLKLFNPADWEHNADVVFPDLESMIEASESHARQ